MKKPSKRRPARSSWTGWSANTLALISSDSPHEIHRIIRETGRESVQVRREALLAHLKNRVAYHIREGALHIREARAALHTGDTDFHLCEGKLHGQKAVSLAQAHDDLIVHALLDDGA
jgi:hypothetical protein